MAMPITVTGLLASAASIETSTKPFVTGAQNIYVFGRGTTGNQLRAFKCTDADTGSFSNVGTDITTNEDITACKAVQSGDEIFVVTVDGDAVGTNRLTLHIFNTSSDTWTTTTEAIVTDYTLLSLAVPKYLSVDMRSDGDLIVLYNGPVVNISAANRETIYYARRESGTWTVNVEVSNAGANNWYVGGIVRGSSDRMHFFIDNDTAADGFQRTLTSGNSLESFPAAYDSSVSTTEASLCGLGCSYDDGGTQRVRYPSRDSGNITCLGLKLDSADAPTVSIDADITGALSIDSGAFRSGMVALGTTLYHVFVDSVDDIYYQTNADDAGWSGNTLFLTATCNGVLPSIYVREGNYKLAMIYNNSTTPVYNELDLGAANTFAEGAFDIDGTGAVTWNGRSTATSAFNQAAVASVTWNGTGLYPGAASLIAAASLTWNGAQVAGGAFDSDEAASLAWNGSSIGASSWSAVTTASVTWNGTSTATSAFDSDAAASLTWNGRSFAASSLTVSAVASLTWNGAQVAGAAWDSDATALLEWIGSSTTAASATDWDSDATASLTWNGAAISASSWSAAAVAALTWNGAGVASATWDSDAAASLTWNGASSASATWDSDAIATLTWNGAQVAGSSWSSTNTALLVWIGDTATAWDSQATSTVTFASATIVAASFECNAVSDLHWVTPRVVRRNIDGGGKYKDNDDEDLPYLREVIQICISEYFP